MEITPYLLFLGNCREAFQFYEKALGGKLDLMTYGSSPEAGKLPAAMRDQVMHARLSAGNTALMGSDCPPEHYAKPQGFSVSVSAADPAETERIFNALVKDGKTKMPLQQTFWSAKFGMLQDKFGIKWMVNCTQAAQTAR
ncbi:MAG TPA: VOC family protein [Candidatus Acidoferrum sp.]|jgi:PhnB protein